MSFPRIILFGTVALFVFIGVAAYVKKGRGLSKSEIAQHDNPKHVKKKELALSPEKPILSVSEPIAENGDFPEVDRVEQFFTQGVKKFPIVETIKYSSKVPWLKGRPAWVADYASHYATSRHFIARSLNGRPDYYTQKVSEGSSFNVLRADRSIQFYILVDLSLCKMGFYYIDMDTGERVLVKTYSVGIGKKANTSSGFLTPMGKFRLGEKIAVYKPGIQGLFQDKPTEMIQVFGTRWLPCESFVEPGKKQPLSKGLGIHGVPWKYDPRSGQYIEILDGVGKPESDGCIRMSSQDIEELFSIVITRNTTVEIVKHFQDARLPGVEVQLPKRT